MNQTNLLSLGGELTFNCPAISRCVLTMNTAGQTVRRLWWMREEDNPPFYVQKLPLAVVVFLLSCARSQLVTVLCLLQFFLIRFSVNPVYGFLNCTKISFPSWTCSWNSSCICPATINSTSQLWFHDSWITLAWICSEYYYIALTGGDYGLA